MKEKKYDLYFENSVKVKSLNDDYFKCYQEIEKCLFKKRKDVLKTNILLSEILDQMKFFQDQGKTVQQVMTKGSQVFVDQIDRNKEILINMKCLEYYLPCVYILCFFLLKNW